MEALKTGFHLISYTLLKVQPFLKKFIPQKEKNFPQLSLTINILEQFTLEGIQKKDTEKEKNVSHTCDDHSKILFFCHTQ